MKRCLMVSGGRLSAEFAREFLKNRTYDLVIAVDAGLSVLETLGICPDAAVGDFDTYGRGRLEEYKKNHAVSLTIHRPEKDEADTELAFSEAFRRGCTHMDILGATGGRLDHELSNIHLLYQGMKRGLSVSIWDEQNRIYLIPAENCGKKTYRKGETYGNYISFLPFTQEVKGITLTGFKYPLFKRDISIFENPSLCVSNELCEEEAVMTFSEGILICVESFDACGLDKKN